MSQTVLIEDPDELIRLDLAQTVRQVWPQAKVILCRHPEEVLAALGAQHAPDLMILRQSWREARARGLAAPALRRGVRVLLTAADPDEAELLAAVGWHAIEMPFSTDQVQTALQDLAAVTHIGDRHCKVVALG